jgi:hypothetical protein
MLFIITSLPCTRIFVAISLLQVSLVCLFVPYALGLVGYQSHFIEVFLSPSDLAVSTHGFYERLSFFWNLDSAKQHVDRLSLWQASLSPAPLPEPLRKSLLLYVCLNSI